MLLFISSKKRKTEKLLTNNRSVQDYFTLPSLLCDPKFRSAHLFILLVSTSKWSGVIENAFMPRENTDTPSDRPLSTGINVTAATCWVVTGYVQPHIPKYPAVNEHERAVRLLTNALFCAADLERYAGTCYSNSLIRLGGDSAHQTAHYATNDP